MATIMRGYLIACLQPKGAIEPETNPSVPQQKEQADSAESKVIVDFNLDVDYEGSEPENESVAQEEEEENLMQNMQR